MATVYLIEPHRDIRDALQTLLESDDRKVRAFPDAETFLAAESASAGKEQGILVAEALLPGLSGIELLKRLRDRGWLQPAFLIVERALPEISTQALTAGANEVLQKPLMQDDLLAALRKVDVLVG